MHPIPKWVANASITQMSWNSICFYEITLKLPNGNRTSCKCFHYANEFQMHPLPKWLPNDTHLNPNDLWSIRFLLISFVKKQFHIVVTFHFWSNPQYGIVRGMVLKQLNSSQLLTNSQSQGYITSITIILMKTMHVLCIIGGDLIYAFLVMHEYATIHALYWSKFWKSHIMLV